jgi:hypothetical protein
MFSRPLGCLNSLLVGCLFANAGWTAELYVGLAKLDITPQSSIRLSGYAGRATSSAGVADRLSVRAMVLAPDRMATDRACILVTLDSILVTNQITEETARWLKSKYGIPRSQLVLCSSHSHSAPHLDGGLNNILREPSTESQLSVTKAYTQFLQQAILGVIDQALSRRQPATLAIAETRAGFGVNRRVLKDGIWSGFGVQSDGQVDHRLRVLRIADQQGKWLGCVTMYACHCTTLNADINQVSSDWAGLAAQCWEVKYPGTVCLPVIGCGADINPNPRGTYEMALQHATEIGGAIEGVMSQAQAWTPLTEFPQAQFDVAELQADAPTASRIAEMQQSEKSNDRRWAAWVQNTLKEHQGAPSAYPMPIHTWQFGPDFTWVFLGGEVVIDYQFRIEHQLPTEHTWVAAYTDDVFAYVASEKMLAEGGYEVDASMVYYLQPGRWQSGTQDFIVRRVGEIFARSFPPSPRP